MQNESNSLITLDTQFSIFEFPIIHFGGQTKCIMGNSKIENVVSSYNNNAFHQSGPGSIPGFDTICALSLLVLYSSPPGFSPCTPVFFSPQKTTFDLISADDLLCPQ